MARSRSSAAWRSGRSTFHQMGTIEYDITKYQPVLLAAESMTHLVDAVGAFFAGFDDDTPARLAREVGAVVTAAG
jgi:phenylalanine-4-hydroxylase